MSKLLHVPTSQFFVIPIPIPIQFSIFITILIAFYLESIEVKGFHRVIEVENLKMKKNTKMLITILPTP